MFHVSRFTIALFIVLMIGPAFLFVPGTWGWIEKHFGPSEEECQRDHDYWRTSGMKHLSSWKSSVCSRRFGTYGTPNG